MEHVIPKKVLNWINGKEHEALSGDEFIKVAPVDGRDLCRVARSQAADVQMALEAAKQAQPAWADLPIVARGDLLRAAALLMRDRIEDLARIVSVETGKSVRDAIGEANAAIEMGLFVAGEGRRFYGRTTTSAIPNKAASIIRQPLGVAGLITAANTPIANVAWKVFPALLCGNAAVLKPSEDTPVSALVFAKILNEVGLPPRIFNVVQGLGEEAGAAIVDSPLVDLISFTGSCEVGRYIQRTAGPRLVKICLELGGKNPLIVCDDADLDLAVQSTILSAFSNAGQRCAAGSRIIVYESIYKTFRDKLVQRTQQLNVGSTDSDDFGPVINEQQLNNMLQAVEEAKRQGAVVLSGGFRLTGPKHEKGFFVAPTLLESVTSSASISRTELFGPISCLYPVRSFDEALLLANDSPYGLTAAIHTQNMHRAMVFVSKIQAGVAVVNGPTYGSEPHMPFGGLKQSGNGFREAGTEALDVYSDWKTVYVNYKPDAV
jgi:alpha-ketoglutaric semialdehyde dehydrogenase